MSQSEKPSVQWDEIFNTSIKFTCPYFLGLVVGTGLKQPVQWIDIMSATCEFFSICYALGVTGNFVYNKIKDFQNKRIKNYQNNQNGR